MKHCNTQTILYELKKDGQMQKGRREITVSQSYSTRDAGRKTKMWSDKTGDIGRKRGDAGIDSEKERDGENEKWYDQTGDSEDGQTDNEKERDGEKEKWYDQTGDSEDGQEDSEKEREGEREKL